MPGCPKFGASFSLVKRFLWTFIFLLHLIHFHRDQPIFLQLTLDNLVNLLYMHFQLCDGVKLNIQDLTMIAICLGFLTLLGFVRKNLQSFLLALAFGLSQKHNFLG